jgi:ankyrin repeat protein
VKKTTEKAVVNAEGSKKDGKGDRLSREELLKALTGRLSTALKMLKDESRAPDIRWIERANEITAKMFANAASVDQATRELAKEAIEKSGFGSEKGIELAIVVALNNENIWALRGAASLSPTPFGQLVIDRGDESMTVAQLAIAVTGRSQKTSPAKMLRAAASVGASLWAVNAEGADALDKAIEIGNADLARWILKQAPDEKAAACARPDGGMSRCQRAVEAGQSETLQALLDAGASCEESGIDRAEDTLLTLAAKLDQVECLRTLLAAGAKIDRPNGRGETALIRAVVEGGAATARELLAQGADANLLNDAKQWALSIAIATKSQTLVGLLAPKTDPALRNARGQGAIAQAAEISLWGAVEALSEHASEEEAIAALAAYARKKMPKITRLAERGMLRLAAEAGQAGSDTEASNIAAGKTKKRKEPPRI